MAVYKTNSDGVGPVQVIHAVPVGRTFQLVSVSVNLSAAPTTSENLTITLDASAGPTYDTLLYSLDLSAGSTADVFWWPDQPTLLQGGDAVVVAYANTDARTIGVQITVRDAA